MITKKTTIALVVGAIISGVAAAYLTKQYIVREIDLHRTQLNSKYETIPVVVARRDLRPGTVLDYDVVALRQVPKVFVHESALKEQNFEIVRGHKLVANVNSGETILLSHASRGKDSNFSSLIEKGKRAITIQVDQISSISGLLKPADHIDILVTLKDNEKRDITFTLLKDVAVLATGNSTMAGGIDGSTSGYQTVTLALSPRDSAQLTHARQTGTITAVLRSPEDGTPAFTETISKTTLLGKGTGAAAEIILGGK